MRKKYAFYLLNIGIPLVVGLGIYLFCYKTTYINTAFTNIFGFSLPYIYFDNAIYRFITCWACDMLWAYSLTFALYLCFRVFKKPLIITTATSSLFAVIIELLQINNVINGTFDILDIIFELLAIFLAIITVKHFEKQKTTNKRCYCSQRLFERVESCFFSALIS